MDEIHLNEAEAALEEAWREVGPTLAQESQDMLRYSFEDPLGWKLGFYDDQIGRYSKDASGHEHKGKGPGGGQFTGPGGSEQGESTGKTEWSRGWSSLTDEQKTKYKDRWSVGKRGRLDAIFDVGVTKTKEIRDGIETEVWNSGVPYVMEMQRQDAYELDESVPEEAMSLAIKDAIGESPYEMKFENIMTGYGDSKDAYGVTGTGHAKEVIDKAANLFAAALERFRPACVYFTAAEASRAKLYKYLTAKIGKHLPYTGMALDVPGMNVSSFAVVSNGSLDSVRELLDSHGIKYHLLESTKYFRDDEILRYALPGRWEEHKHPRGQPENAGQFSSTGHAASAMHGKHADEVRPMLHKAGLKFHHHDVMDALHKSGAMKHDHKGNLGIHDHEKFHDVMHAAIHGTHRATGQRVDDLAHVSQPRPPVDQKAGTRAIHDAHAKLAGAHGGKVPLDKLYEQARQHEPNLKQGEFNEHLASLVHNGEVKAEGAMSQEDADRSGWGTIAKVGRIAQERHTPPPPGDAYNPNVEHDQNGDGITDAARVGVPAFQVPPPPAIGRVPNLTEHERSVEENYLKEFEKNPEKMAHDFLNGVRKTAQEKGEAPTFGTDDAKLLSNDWMHPELEQMLVNRSTLNVALHNTANAICKRAFLKHLNTMKPGQRIMVTVGGCGAGKGYALGVDEKTGQPFIPKAYAIKQAAHCVWDSAGDQNATENPWIQHEAEKRGLMVDYVYVHADPKNSWGNEGMGVVARANKPKDGRMVDAKVFADSYAIGAKNHQQHYENNRNNPHATFTFLQNGKVPKEIPGMPEEALNINRHELTKFATEKVKEMAAKGLASERVLRGATMHERVWPEE